MKSILFVNGHLNTGGIEKTLIDYLNYIDYTRYSVDLLLLEDKGDYEKKLPSNVNVILFKTKDAEGPLIKTICNNLLSLNFRMIIYRLVILLASKLSRQCLKLLKYILPIKKNYNYVISYRTGICSEVVAYAIQGEKKLCWWHNGEFNMTEEQKLQAFKTWRYYDNLVAVSEGCRDLLAREFPLLSDRMVVLHNILDISRLSKFALENEAAYPPSRIKIVSVGNLTKRKHFDNAIIAVKHLLENGISDFYWIIIGDGEERKNLQNMIDEFNVSSNIVLVGKMVNPYPVIKHADLMVHTSYGEAHCTSVLEAMALNTPCIVTKTSIPQDFTIDEYNCYMVKQGVDSLVQKMMSVMSSLPKTDQLTKNAFNFVNCNYTPEVIISSFEKLLN